MVLQIAKLQAQLQAQECNQAELKWVHYMHSIHWQCLLHIAFALLSAF